MSFVVPRYNKLLGTILDYGVEGYTLALAGGTRKSLSPRVLHKSAFIPALMTYC